MLIQSPFVQRESKSKRARVAQEYLTPRGTINIQEFGYSVPAKPNARDGLGEPRSLNPAAN